MIFVKESSTNLMNGNFGAEKSCLPLSFLYKKHTRNKISFTVVAFYVRFIYPKRADF